MACYAAVISLKLTIQRLRDSSQISILPPSLKILEAAYGAVTYMENFVTDYEESINKNNSNERVFFLEGQLTKAAYKLEDALESRALNQYENSLGDHEGSSLTVSLDLQEAEKEIDFIIKMITSIKMMMRDEIWEPFSLEEIAVPSKIGFGGNNSKMVGLSKEFNQIKSELTNGFSGRQLYFIPIVGMAGIGKTTLAMKLFEDPDILSGFDLRVFVSVGLKYKFRKLMLSILVEMDHDINEIHRKDDGELAEYIRGDLQGRRYLIVLDDVWNKEEVIELKILLPRQFNGSRVLLTTRSQEVAYFADIYSVYRMSFLSKEESWDLLREKVFGEGYTCPSQLVKFGKKIAEKCEGLPLTIITVADILSKGEKTVEYWKKAAEKENSIFTDAYDRMTEVLVTSYNHLPQYLKPCFLYIGVFPLSCKIPVSKLVKLWHAEGFLDLYPLTDFEVLAKACVRELDSRSVVLVNQPSFRDGSHIKTCYLHSAYWHLCIKEASKKMFFHALRRYASSFVEGIKSQRRLCIHNNVLFGIKEVRNSIEESVPMARSLLCTGPHHQYPVPLCFGLRLLRVLDALTIRFYKFPIAVLKLVRLRYLALTYSGKIPGSIAELWNLEQLIVHRHLSINKSPRDSSYLPMEIWNMKELRHIKVEGRNLRDPCGALLPNLLTLSNVSVNSCSKEILERTPNLKRLGIQFEFNPDVFEPLHCFDHPSHLQYLESLKCVVVNPKPRSQVVASITTFPIYLKKLSLSGLGYPWDCMRTIAQMQLLEVLKLRCYAFQGSFWRIYKEEFDHLKYLLIEDTDLVRWKGDVEYGLRSLKQLIIRHCYKLKEIPSTLGCPSILDPSYMELVDCPSIEASVEQLKEQHPNFNIYVRSSLDDEE